jgi:putative transposase
MLRAYKFRLNPTADQKILIGKHIGSCRYVFNWALAQKIKTYEETAKSVSQFELNKQLTQLKKEQLFLKEVNAQSLQGMTKQVESAFTRFFREKKGFPNFGRVLKLLNRHSKR